MLALFGSCLVVSTARAQDIGNLFRVRDSVSDTHVEYHDVKLPRGTETVLADLTGPGKITYWYITDDSGGHFYSGLVLKVYWDDETDPSINVPLSDFFGAIGGHTIDYHSLPMQIEHFCYMCYLPMPFSKRARIVLANDGDRDYRGSMAYGFDFERGDEFAHDKSRLCCAWRRSNPVRNGLHTIIDVHGHGHYVGNFLQVFTRASGWWGEGDTIFHRDGKVFTHSPGTEDEYGACWGFGNTFASPNCGYLQNGKGENRMYRWYIANPVRFRDGLKVEIQNQHNNGTPTTTDADDYTSVAFWYQEDRRQPVTLQPYSERIAVSKAGRANK